MTDKTKYCLGFAFNEKLTDVLLIEKQKPDWQKGKFNGIGGKIEGDELPINAMVREFQEETGLFVPSHQWRYVVKMEGEDWIVYAYTCKTDDVFEANTETDEMVTLIGLDSLDKYNLISNLYWLIEMCLDKSINYTVTTKP